MEKIWKKCDWITLLYHWILVNQLCFQKMLKKKKKPKLAPLSFSYVPVIFWAILYFLAQENVPDFTNGSSCNFPASAWELAVSLRSSREESDIWRPKSEYFIAYCFWLSSIAGLLVYRGGTYIHVNMCMCVCMYVYVYPGYYYNYFYICLFLKVHEFALYLHSISISRLFLAFPLSLYVTSFSVNKKTFFHYFRYRYLCAPSLILWVISLLCWSHPWLPHSFAATFVVITTPRSGGKGWGGKERKGKRREK